MSSMDVATSAASAPVRDESPVIARTPLRRSAIVTIKVNKDATFGSFTRDEKTVHFLHFVRLVTGGAVHCFVHGRDLSSYIGKKITATMIPMVRVHANGHRMVYIDLKVPDSKLKPNREIAIKNNDRPWSKNKDFEVIETAGKVRGVIILAPVGTKIDVNIPAN